MAATSTALVPNHYGTAGRAIVTQLIGAEMNRGGEWGEWKGGPGGINFPITLIFFANPISSFYHSIFRENDSKTEG